jgi:hypothetical protein
LGTTRESMEAMAREPGLCPSMEAMAREPRLCPSMEANPREPGSVRPDASPGVAVESVAGLGLV